MVAISAILGVAFKALSKVKKSAWNAMKGAMQSVKGAASPLGAIAKIFMFLSPIMKVFGILFTILGAAIMQSVFPAIQLLIAAFTDPAFIEQITALGAQIGALIVALMTPEFIETLIKLIEGVIGFATALLTPKLIETLGKLINSITRLALAILTDPGFIQNIKELALQISKLVETVMVPGFIAGITALVSGLVGLAIVITGAFKPILDWLGTLNPSEIARLFYVLGLGISTLLGMIYGGPIGALIAAAAWAIGMSGLLSYQHGTPYVPQTGAYWLHRGEKVVTAKDNRKGRGEIHIHIDLRNSVIDNVERFSRKIAEQVLIQIG